MSDSSEGTLSFKFFISSFELLRNEQDVSIYENIAIAFQLFDFYPVRIVPQRFQRDPSSPSKYIVRGGKICQFRSSRVEIQKRSVASFLKVMLYHNRGTYLAAGEMSMDTLLTAFLANGVSVKKRVTITVFNNTQCPFADLKLKLCLEVVGCGANERDPTEQVHAMQYRGIGDLAACSPPVTVLVQPRERNVTAGATLDKLVSPSVPSLNVNHSQEARCSSIVWPNGYIEDADPYLQHNTCEAESSYVLPSTGAPDNVARHNSDSYPLLEALCDEILLIQKRRKDPVAELAACKNPKVTHNKCLQTDELRSETLKSKEVTRKQDKSPIRPFTRTCCMMSQERVPQLLPNAQPQVNQSLREHVAAETGKSTSLPYHTRKKVPPGPRSQVKLSKPTLSYPKNSHGDDSVPQDNQSSPRVACKLNATPGALERAVTSIADSILVQATEDERISGLQSSRSPRGTEVPELLQEGLKNFQPSDDRTTELPDQQFIPDTPRTANSISEVPSHVTRITEIPSVPELVISNQKLHLAPTKSSQSDHALCENVQHSLPDGQEEMTREGINQEQPVFVQSLDSLDSPELQDLHVNGDVHADAYESDFEDINENDDDGDDDDDDDDDDNDDDDGDEDIDEDSLLVTSSST